MTEVNLDQTFVFTERRIRDLPEVAVGKRVRYRDEDCPGLILRVTSGAKVFAFRIWKSEVTIGKWPAWSVEQARSHVRTKVAPNPKEAQAQKRAEREAQTLGEAWAALEAHPFRRDGKGRLREGTVKSYQLSWRHLQPWAGRPLEEITCALSRNSCLIRNRMT